MSEILSKERVGQLARRATLAFVLAGAVKGFIRLTGTKPHVQQTGGWKELNLDPLPEPTPIGSTPRSETHAPFVATPGLAEVVVTPAEFDELVAFLQEPRPEVIKD